MSGDIWTLVRFLQLLAAATWVGGMIVLGAVAGPAARLAGDRAAARRVVTSVWRRFGVIGTLAGVVLIATGSAYPPSGDRAGRSRTQRLRSSRSREHRPAGGDWWHHPRAPVWQGPRGRRARAAGDLAAVRRWHRLGVVGDGLLLQAALAALWLAVSLGP